MAKQKSDRHKFPGKTIRLPKDQAIALRIIAEQEERTDSVVISRALRLYAQTHGYNWPGLPPAGDTQPDEN